MLTSAATGRPGSKCARIMGIYARIRHPMYAAIWISTLAQPLLIHNWIAGALVVPAFTAMWFLRTPREEVMMRERFGAQ
ncbi:MAG: isoprenylcysteine carboxylmethyltransferase family protein [Sphingobium sp.]